MVRRVFYGWWLVGITILILAVVIGPTFQGMGVFFVALERHFGWTRTMLSGAFSLSRAEGALVGPLEGFLTDRLGTRRMVLIGFLVLGAGFIGLSLIQNVVAFYLAFLVLFSGAGLGGFLPLMAAINHWFVRRRTIAMGIGMTGVNLGGLLVPLLAWAVTSAGWRATAMGLGIAIWALALPLALLVRNRPEEYGLRPDGDPVPDPSGARIPAHREATGQDDAGFTVGEALRTSAFWTITATHGFSAVATVTLSIHIIPALTDTGMSLGMAGLIVATYTITGVVFQLVAGFLGDLFPKPPLIAFFVITQGIGVLMAATVTTLSGAFLFAFLYGMGFGGRTPLLTAIRGDYFGRKAFATLLGISQAPMNIAMVAAPILAGYLFDIQRSYAVPFFGLAALNFLASALILLARKPALSATHVQRQKV